MESKRFVLTITLMMCCVAFSVFILGLTIAFGKAPNKKKASAQYIYGNNSIVKLEVIDDITLEDDTIEKLQPKIKVTTTGEQGEFGSLVKVTENNIMFDYTLENKTHYFSTLGINLGNETKASYTAASGTTSINTKKSLEDFRKNVNNGNSTYANQTVQLTSNINLNNDEWEPIGWGLNNNFQGTFDGNNKTISNFKITKAFVKNNSISPGVGLFGFIEKSCTIKNLRISNASITLGDTENNDTPYGYGILVGYFGNSNLSKETSNDNESLRINNCAITNSSITVTNGLKSKRYKSWCTGIGGLIGSSNLSVSIQNCSVNVDIDINGQMGGSGAGFTRYLIGGVMGGHIKGCENTRPKGHIGISNCLYDGIINLAVTSSFNNGSVAGILGGADCCYLNNYDIKSASVTLEDNYAHMGFSVSGVKPMSANPICGGNAGEWSTATGYTYKFCTNDCSTTYKYYKPFYKISMYKNYFTLKSNNTSSNAESLFRTLYYLRDKDQDSYGGTFYNSPFTDDKLYVLPNGTANKPTQKY